MAVSTWEEAQTEEEFLSASHKLYHEARLEKEESEDELVKAVHSVRVAAWQQAQIIRVSADDGWLLLSTWTCIVLLALILWRVW